MPWNRFFVVRVTSSIIWPHPAEEVSDKFTSRYSKGDTTPKTRRIERMILEICMNLSEMFFK